MQATCVVTGAIAGSIGRRNGQSSPQMISMGNAARAEVVCRLPGTKRNASGGRAKTRTRGGWAGAVARSAEIGRAAFGWPRRVRCDAEAPARRGLRPNGMQRRHAFVYQGDPLDANFASRTRALGQTDQSGGKRGPQVAGFSTWRPGLKPSASGFPTEAVPHNPASSRRDGGMDGSATDI